MYMDQYISSRYLCFTKAELKYSVGLDVVWSNPVKYL